MNWSPVDKVTFRSSYGTSFRAPLLSQIYGNSNGLYVQSYQNPAGGSPIVGVAKSGANLDLKPETAQSWTFGADIDPITGLRLSATFWSVDYKDQVIGLLSDLSVLTRLSQYDGTGLIVQGPSAAPLVASYIAQGLPVNGALPGGSASNVTLFVYGANFNLGRSITRGIDFQPSYRMRTDAGTFGFNFNGTYLTEYSTLQTPTAPSINQLNQIFQPLRFKANTIVTWEKGPNGARVRINYVNGYLNNAVTPNQNVSAYSPVDVTFTRWLFGVDTGFKLAFEVRNVFDQKPPYVNIAPSVNGSGGYDATTTDPIGRTVAVSIRKNLHLKK